MYLERKEYILASAGGAENVNASFLLTKTDNMYVVLW